MSDLSMLINGLKVSAEGGTTFERRNPLDGSVATRAPAASPADAVLAGGAGALQQFVGLFGRSGGALDGFLPGFLEFVAQLFGTLDQRVGALGVVQQDVSGCLASGDGAQLFEGGELGLQVGLQGKALLIFFLLFGAYFSVCGAVVAGALRGVCDIGMGLLKSIYLIMNWKASR